MKNLVPYQIFFPLGVLSSLLAVGVWLLEPLGIFSIPAMFIHSKLIMGGFIWSFIVGFLMTAVPRMTGAQGARVWEKYLGGILLLGLIISSWSIDGRNFYFINMLLIVSLVIFIVTRFTEAKKSPPIFFSHVALGMVLAFAGNFAYFVGEHTLGLHLYHVGSVLLLILGIGTRFFSFLSGLPSIFEESKDPAIRYLFHSMSFVIAALVFFAGLGFYGAYLGLSIVTLGYLLVFWQVQRKSARPSALKYGVRFVAFTLPVSFFMCWLQPAMYITWLHLLFIGCFSVLTYAVATRVTLAHGSYSLELETQSKALWVLIAALVLSVIVRLYYGVTSSELKMNALYLASVLWLTAIIAWSYSFLIRIWKKGSLEKAAC